MTTSYIYTLTNPKNDQVFYVGCTKNPELRFKQHTLNKYLKTKKDKYISEMGCTLVMTIVQIVREPETLPKYETTAVARQAEYALFKKLTEMGCNLTNSNKSFSEYLNRVVLPKFKNKIFTSNVTISSVKIIVDRYYKHSNLELKTA